MAQLSVDDLHAQGDGLLTVDASSGLAWLDLSVTRGLSLTQVTSSDWMAQGFRFASTSEVLDLAAQARLPYDFVEWMGGWSATPEISAYMGGPTTVLAGIVDGDALLDDGSVRLLNFWLTRDTVIPTGSTLLDYAREVMPSAIEFPSEWPPLDAGNLTFLRSRESSIAVDVGSVDAGIFLVRSISAVPELATWMSMCVGLFGLWGVQRHRRTA